MLRCISIILLVCGSMLAQSLVDAPSAIQSSDFVSGGSHDGEPGRFLDKPNLALLASLTVVHGFDAYHTELTLSDGGKEMFPVARGFCQNRNRRIAYFATNYTLTIASSYLLHRMHHRKLARLALIAGSVSSASGLMYTLSHR